MSRLTDKIVLITGAAGAIGRAVAAAVTRERGIAVATDIVRDAGIDHRLDVTVEADWQHVLAELDRAHGRLDGLVNAAGIALLGSVEDTDYASWRRVLAVNLDGTFLGCKQALALLKRGGGSIVNLSSVSGIVGGHNLAAYNASKGGVRLLTKSVALHGARLKPRCELQLGASGVFGRTDGGRRPRADRPAGYRPQSAGARYSARAPRTAVRGGGSLCVYLLSDELQFVTGAAIRHRWRPDRALSCGGGAPDHARSGFSYRPGSGCPGMRS